MIVSSDIPLFRKDLQMRAGWAIVLGLFICTAGVQAADPAPEEKTGIKVGEKAPKFELQDHSGKKQTLAALHEDGAVALVFYRSASW